MTFWYETALVFEIAMQEIVTIMYMHCMTTTVIDSIYAAVKQERV